MKAGYTLLELLVALALFSLASALAFNALSRSLAVASRVKDEAAYWRSMSSAWTLMERDVAQCSAAPRDAALGQPEGPELQLWLAPGQATCAACRERRTKVVYRVVGDVLMRFASFDRGEGSERVASSRLLTGVEAFAARASFPPDERRPWMVEAELTMKNRGRWSRTFECPR